MAEDANAAALALSRLLDVARMDRENEGAHGERVLAEAEAALAKLTEGGALGQDALQTLGACYHHAGLEVPEVLVAHQVAQIDAAGDGVEPEGVIAQKDAALDEVFRNPPGSAYEMYRSFGEALATMPAEGRAAMAHQVAARDQDICRELALYWVLDPSPVVGAAAAAGLREQAEAGTLDAVTAARLPMLRTWLPPGPPRAALDSAIRAARRSAPDDGRQGANEKETGAAAWRPEILAASLPDGSGSQSFVVLSKRGRKLRMAMVLTKAGQGIKDAYPIDVGSRDQADAILDAIAEEVALEQVSQETLVRALAAGAAESRTAGVPPAPGLLDAAVALGLRELAPQETAPRDWLAVLDSDGKLSGISPQRRGQLIRKSGDWLDAFAEVDSWFEDTAAIRESIDMAGDAQAATKAVLGHLEARREAWARRMLLSALVLRDGMPENWWLSFAATGAALLDGRPLGRIPVMTQIAETTVTARHAVLARAAAGDDQVWDDKGETPDPDEPATSVQIEIDTEAGPEKVGEALRCLGLPDVQQAWLDGYLAAVAAAPKMAPPNEWMQTFLSAIPPDIDMVTVQRSIGVIMGRYNAVAAELHDGAVTDLNAEALPVWAQGFSDALKTVPGAWPRRQLQADDKKMLDHLAGLGQGRETASAADASLIAQWLPKRFAARR